MKGPIQTFTKCDDKSKKKLNKQLVRGKNSVGNKDGDDSVSTSAKAFSNPCPTVNE